MIVAAPGSPGSNSYQLRDGARVLGELRLRWWGVGSRARWRLVLADEPYELSREGFLGGAFVLAQGRRVLARAMKPAWGRDDYEVELGTGRVSLRKVSIPLRRYVVLAGEREVGSIHRTDPHSRHTVVDLPAQWPLPERMFVLWLALRIWSRVEAADRA